VLITLAAALAAIWIASIIVVIALCRMSAIGDGSVAPAAVTAARVPDTDSREAIGSHAEYGLGGVFVAP